MTTLSQRNRQRPKTGRQPVLNIVKPQLGIKLFTGHNDAELDFLSMEAHTLDDTVREQIDLDKLVGKLRMACLQQRAYGVAGNQVGVALAIFVAHFPGPDGRTPSGHIQEFINPNVVVRKKQQMAGRSEGCLSFPGFEAFIERENSVRIKWEDLKGEQHTETFTGLSARIILHEMDHLKGKTIVDQAFDQAINRQMRREYERQLSKHGLLRKPL